MKKGNYKEDGITLIALIIAIIILLILTSVVLASSLSDNGFFQRAKIASILNSHTTVWESIEIVESDYELAKQVGEYKGSLIEYFKSKKIIPNEESESYKIDVIKLVGSKLSTGNGTDTDIYKLEDATEEVTKVGKIASTQPLKIAETTSNKKVYKVVYYGKKGIENRELGKIKDN